MRIRTALAALSVVVGVVAMFVLHLMPAGAKVNPVREPISNYAETPYAWLFDIAVLALAVGLTALLSALVRSGCMTLTSPVFAIMSACCLGLVMIVIFPDRITDSGLTASAQVHWTVSMLTFGGLAFAPVWLGHRHSGGCAGLPRLARRVSVVSVAWFVSFVAGSILHLATSLQLWPVGGLVERGLVGTELAVVAILAGWAWRGCRCALGDELGHRLAHAEPEDAVLAEAVLLDRAA